MAKNEKSRSFGVMLRRFREAAGLTQEQLATRTREMAGEDGVTLSSVTKLEQGDRDPNWSTVLALADALGIPVGDFRNEDVRPAEPLKRGRPKKRAD